MTGLAEAKPRTSQDRAPSLALAQRRAAAIHSLIDLDPDLAREEARAAKRRGSPSGG
jgi:hypothetical protein